MAGSFIVLSDIHFNLWSYGDPSERLEQQLTAFGDALTFAVEHEVDAILVPGDIFHTQGSVQTQVLRGVFCALQHYINLRDRIVFLPGNHDMVFRTSGAHALDFLPQFGRAALGEIGAMVDPIMIPHMPMIWTIPYSDNHEAVQSRLGFGAHRDGDLILMHQGVKGVDFQSKGFVLDEGISADMVPDGVFHAFVGHCHSLRRVSKNMTVPGALMQHNFGDAGDQRGFLYCTFDDHDLVMSQQKVDSPQFVSLDYMEDHRLLKETCEQYVEEGDYVRVINVPISRIGEVRAWTEKTARNDVKIVTCPDSSVALRPATHEVSDIAALFDRFVEENRIEGKTLDVGREIMRAKNALS